MTEKLKTFRISNGRDNSLKSLSCTSQELCYEEFAKKVLIMKGMNEYLIHCLSIKYKNKKGQYVHVIDQKSFSDFIDLGIQNLEVKIIGDEYLNQVFIQDCRKRKFNLLSQLNNQIRQERQESISERINQSRAMKSILQSQINSYQRPQQCLEIASNHFNQLCNKISSYDHSIKSISNSLAFSILLNQPVNNTKNIIQGDQNLYDHKMNCSNCQKNIMGMRHQCTICEYNLCDECMIRNAFNHSHKYFIEIPNSDEFLKEIDDTMFLTNEPTSLMSPLRTQENEHCGEVDLGYYISIDTTEDLTDVSLWIAYKTSCENIELVIEGNIQKVQTRIFKLSDESLFRVKFIYESPEEGEYQLKGIFMNEEKNIGKPFTIVVNIK